MSPEDARLMEFFDLSGDSGSERTNLCLHCGPWWWPLKLSRYVASCLRLWSVLTHLILLLRVHEVVPESNHQWMMNSLLNTWMVTCFWGHKPFFGSSSLTEILVQRDPGHSKVTSSGSHKFRAFFSFSSRSGEPTKWVIVQNIEPGHNAMALRRSLRFNVGQHPTMTCESSTSSTANSHSGAEEKWKESRAGLGGWWQITWKALMRERRTIKTQLWLWNTVAAAPITVPLRWRVNGPGGLTKMPLGLIWYWVTVPLIKVKISSTIPLL